MRRENFRSTHRFCVRRSRDFRLIAGPDLLVVQPVVHRRGAEQRDIEGRLGHAAVVEVDNADLLVSEQYLLRSKRTVGRNERVGGDSRFQSAQLLRPNGLRQR